MRKTLLYKGDREEETFALFSGEVRKSGEGRLKKRKNGLNEIKKETDALDIPFRCVILV